MNTKPCLLKLVTLFALLSHAQLCFATPPSALNYQGHLTDNNGMPANGIVAMTFRLYDVSVGGIPLWSDTRTDVNVNHGVFSIELGTSTSSPFPPGLFEQPL